jgi:hypothetical protein
MSVTGTDLVVRYAAVTPPSAQFTMPMTALVPMRRRDGLLPAPAQVPEGWHPRLISSWLGCIRMTHRCY